VVDADTLNTFKSRLDKHWFESLDRDVLCNFHSKLTETGGASIRMWCCKRYGQRGIPATVYSHWIGLHWKFGHLDIKHCFRKHCVGLACFIGWHSSIVQVIMLSHIALCEETRGRMEVATSLCNLNVAGQLNIDEAYSWQNKKLSYRRVTARCVLSVVSLQITTQQCRNYLDDKSWPNRWYEVGGLVGGNVS